MLINCLSELTISCDNFSRGCREFIQLGDLQTHVISCGFAPVKCSNNDCDMEVNKRDKIHHETEVCDFRKVKCHDCGEMKKEIEGIKNQLNQLPGMKTQLNELSSVKEDMKEVKAMMGEVLQKLNNVEHVIQVPLHVNPTKEDIVIAGGYTGHGPTSSVEKFSWSKRAWAQLPPMKECRSEASSFVYENQIFVAGGYTGSSGRTDTMEVLKIDEQPLKWTESPAKLPFKCDSHKTVVYQNSLIHIGGYNATENKFSDAISEVLLTPPYSKKLLCRMPQSRVCHGVEIFNDKILILGGSSSYSDGLDSVFMYDVNKNKLKQMPSLPRAVSRMSTVRWEDKVVVIGGCGKDDKALSDVLMYDSKTGESNVLPSMLHKRRGCSAIITGNVIVVMGGWNEKDKYLSSVECFTLGGYSWEELPPMIEPRHLATAVVMPSTF